MSKCMMEEFMFRFVEQDELPFGDVGVEGTDLGGDT